MSEERTVGGTNPLETYEQASTRQRNLTYSSTGTAG